MKPMIINSIRSLMTIMMLSTLIIISSCNGGDGNKSKEKESSPAIEKPPAIDIHTATIIGDLDAINQHIKAGSDLNIKEPTGGSTPLISAIVFGKMDVAMILIEGGADVNIPNNDGSTPLYCAAFFCHQEIVQALLDKGADKSIRNSFGTTALETVSMPFENVRPVYEQFSKDLGPMGFKLDYEQLEETRPIIAEMLR